jgi:hypothetical protein
MDQSLPAHVTASIDTLVDLITNGRPVPADLVRSSLEGLVQAGISIAEHRQGNGKTTATYTPSGMEIRGGLSERAAADDDDEDMPLPADACRAVFNAPRAARSARTARPCGLKRGHSGAHQNDKGVSWGTRSNGPKPAEVRSPAPAVRSSTMSSQEDLKARTQRLARQMTRQATRSAGRTINRANGRSGPVEAAQRAVQLATPPQWGWMSSERRVVLERLEQAGARLLQHAVDHRATDTAHHREVERLRQRLLDARTLLMPGSSTDVQQATLDRLTGAMRALYEPLASQQRIDDSMARSFAARAQTANRPATPEPRHPWLPDRIVA